MVESTDKSLGFRVADSFSLLLLLLPVLEYELVFNCSFESVLPNPNFDLLCAQAQFRFGSNPAFDLSIRHLSTSLRGRLNKLRFYVASCHQGFTEVSNVPKAGRITH